MNVLVLLSIFADAALLSSLTYLEPVLQMELCFYIATGITIAWLVVMSMPHAMSSDQNCLKPLVCRSGSNKSREVSDGKFRVGFWMGS